MGLQQRLDTDLKDAMRQRHSVKVSLIRSLRNAINYETISRGETLEDQDVLGVLHKQAKQRRESIAAFRKGARQDLVNKEEEELSFILEYLPRQMDREEIAEIVTNAIRSVGAKGMADKGILMKQLMPELKGKADGSKVNQVVSDLLEALDRK
jgi:uncharacterized protein YqeY